MYNYQATKEAVISDPQMQQPHDNGIVTCTEAVTPRLHTRRKAGEKTWKTKDPNSASKMNIGKAKIHRMGLTDESFEVGKMGEGMFRLLIRNNVRGKKVEEKNR